MSANKGDFNYSPLLTLVCSSQVVQASPIFASPSGATYGAHSRGSPMAFQTSDKSRKLAEDKNTLDYFAAASVTKIKKFCNIDTWSVLGLCDSLSEALYPSAISPNLNVN